MNQVADTDPSRFYQDSHFPGRRLIAWAVGIWAVGIVLPGWILNPDALPAWVTHVQTFLLVLVIPLYFIGFWKSIVGKGYPRILFLMSFAPLLGLLILFYLPQREGPVTPKSSKSEQDVTPNA